MTERISLDDSWNLIHYPAGGQAANHPDDLPGLGITPIPAQVPGNVELDLVRAGDLSDPFYADHIRRLRPLEAHTWWLYRTFTAPAFPAGQRWQLVFAGLDTLATVWLNGSLLGSVDNMLIEQRFDTSAALLPGTENTLAVRIDPVVSAARQFSYDSACMSWEQREEGLYIRKAPHMWGWDIMPRAVSAGIWRPVWLESVDNHAIEQLYMWTKEISPQGAVLGARFQFRTNFTDLEGVNLHFHGTCADHSFDYDCPVEFTAGGCSIPIPEARLWWPRGYGAPNLYKVCMQLRKDEQVLAERSEWVGIRKLVVDRTELAGEAWLPEPAALPRARQDVPPNPESHFLFYVNDQPVMIKGTNWVPLDALHSRDAERLEQAIALVDDLGCNMIRCWGGNVYAEDRFFDLCDEKGILVWQDFAFACCRYPGDAEYLAKVRIEVSAVVQRLRNHACLAIWCGDNEIDMAYLADGLSPEYNRLNREVIPQIVHRHDPYRAYVPSSPYAPPAVAGRLDAWQATPEQHLWGPRGYYKAPFYTRHSAHFIGEIGYHGCPSLESIQRFISPEHLWPWQDNDEWQVHSVYHWQHKAVTRDRIQLMANQVWELFGMIPDNIEDFIFASQATQAEAVKFFIESTRLRKWQTSGILWWNVLDGWPQFSDAVVDYYFNKKLAYHFIRRAQQPVCVIVGEAAQGAYLPVVVCNDTLQDVVLRYRLKDADSLAVLSLGEIKVPANQNWQADHFPPSRDSGRMILIEWEVVGGQSSGSHYLEGTPPIPLERYRRWLEQIRQLP
jgi:beta-mannosidase